MKFDCLKLKFMIIIYADSTLSGNKDWPFPEGASLHQEIIFILQCFSSTHTSNY